jgi:hypothetical protein
LDGSPRSVGFEDHGAAARETEAAHRDAFQAVAGFTGVRFSKLDGGATIKVAYSGGIEATSPNRLSRSRRSSRYGCRVATFESNPATCPVASNVGTVTVTNGAQITQKTKFAMTGRAP